ncbi:unnamed protein product [Owenia fusiformis]|uniref:Uncharacterized protein n=1 Tax=Owenia fusiformis TaxID=6347 RepID=A0A8S4PWN1_OWEFU|nr:unnamed protein product [Owenia fusiformis]
MCPGHDQDTSCSITMVNDMIYPYLEILRLRPHAFGLQFDYRYYKVEKPHTLHKKITRKYHLEYSWFQRKGKVHPSFPGLEKSLWNMRICIVFPGNNCIFNQMKSYSKCCSKPSNPIK